MSAAQRAAQRPAGGLAPRWRIAPLMLAFFGLFIGAGAGLARLGWGMPALAVSAAGLHGPLMICGFFGVVIALERAVAIGRSWAYLGPLLAGLGSACAVFGAVSQAGALFLAGSLVLLGASVDVWWRQRALFTFTLALGAACWSIGNALWLAGGFVHDVVPWWLAFLILTIAGERLELSRFLPPSPAASRIFAVLLGSIVAGLLGARSAWGQLLFGAGVLGLAAWLLKQDIARRTVRGRGLTRFIAVCLLSGYVWLALGGAVILLAGGLQPATAGYDAALHAIALGFVFSMVFGHAPLIFPAVLRLAVPYHATFYAPLALLHASLVMRLLGDASSTPGAVRAGALLNALALLGFITGTALAVLRGRRALMSRKRRASHASHSLAGESPAIQHSEQAGRCPGPGDDSCPTPRPNASKAQ